MAASVIVLLRGVNVGGRKLPMAAVRSGLEAAGCTEVATYIQSGNVVLRPPVDAPDPLAPWLEEQLSSVAGFDVRVALRTLDELRRTVADNPFPQASGTLLHVAFFAGQPADGVLADLDLPSFLPEECRLVGRDLYLHLPNGMGRARLPVAMERGAARTATRAVVTTRNWNTVLRLVELASG